MASTDSAHYQRWLEGQAERFARLAGIRVTRAVAVEMAFLEQGQDRRPVFDHPAFPFLQLLSLDLESVSQEILRISTYQNDDNWGLRIESVPPSSQELAGIYRRRPIDELAGHSISDASLSYDDVGDITEVRLSFPARPQVVLVAGEVHETRGGATVHRQDESVLLFWSSEQLASFPFGEELCLGAGERSPDQQSPPQAGPPQGTGPRCPS